MRRSGILLPISSLNGKYGIGTLGKEAFAFVDFCLHQVKAIGRFCPLVPQAMATAPIKAFPPLPATLTISI